MGIGKDGRRRRQRSWNEGKRSNRNVESRVEREDDSGGKERERALNCLGVGHCWAKAERRKKMGGRGAWQNGKR